MNKKTIWIIIAIAVVILGALYLFNRNNTQPSATSYLFTCESGNVVNVAYSGKDNKNALVLAGGEGYNLERAISASGSKYTNDDESVVFWEHAGEVTVEKNGKKIEEGCFVARNDVR